MSNIIRQSLIFNVSPHEVYEALMDSAKHAAITKSETRMSRDVGGEYQAYGGYICGRNLELEPDRKIVQSWHAMDWPDDHFSVVTFLFSPIPEGTRLDFTHVNLPEGTEVEFEQGWIDNYWQPMKSFFANA